MTIRDLARKDVTTIHRDQTAGNLATLLKEAGVGCAVVEDDGRPVGIATDRDLVLEVLAPHRDPRDVTVGEIMTPDPETVHEDAGVFETTERMAEAAVRRIPVVDEVGTLVGIITLDDLLVTFTTELKDLAGVVVAESPPGAGGH
jgi:CBS domain-containing protein